MPPAMRFNLHAIVFFAANALLFFLCSLANSQLAAVSLHLILLGLMPIAPALYLKYPSFLFCSALTGLWVDAGLASSYGLFTCGFPIIGTFIRSVRLRFRDGTGYRLTLLSHLANFCCIFLLQFNHSLKYFFHPDLWAQLLAITLLSHVILHLVASWFFRFELMLLELLKLEFQADDDFTTP